MAATPLKEYTEGVFYMSDVEKKMDKMSREEYDVDTGTYMEDVHANDSIIGRDADSDGLVDDVEKLIAEASVRAEAFNEEQRQIEKERKHYEGPGRETQRKEEKEGPGM